MGFIAAGGKAGPGRDIPHVLQNGTLPKNDLRASWVSMELNVVGTRVIGTVDGHVVGTVDDDTFHKGMVAVGSGWNEAYFDDFGVSADPHTLQRPPLLQNVVYA